MLRATLICGALAWTSLGLAEDGRDQLDAKFLEYLATLEGEDDDWTLLADAEEQLKDANTPVEIQKDDKASVEATKEAEKKPPSVNQPEVEQR